MVKLWIKQLNSLNKNSKINFDKIILDLLNLEFEKYNIKNLPGFEKLFRLRVWDYRVIFRKIDNEVKILFIWKRWDVYKWLKKL